MVSQAYLQDYYKEMQNNKNSYYSPLYYFIYRILSSIIFKKNRLTAYFLDLSV